MNYLHIYIYTQFVRVLKWMFVDVMMAVPFWIKSTLKLQEPLTLFHSGG